MMRHKIGFKDCLWWIQSHLKLPLSGTKEIVAGTKKSLECQKNVFLNQII